MAYVAPTVAELKAAFPRFDAVAEATVQLWLDRAGRDVGETWTEGDYAHAIMLMAAHLMTTEGLGTGAEAEAAAAGASGFQRMRSGSLELERAAGTAAERNNPLLATTYGKRFVELARKNLRGPRITATGALPTTCAPYCLPE